MTCSNSGAIMASDTYVCSLSEKTLKKAKKELGEDPKQRMGAVESFREWILQQKHIKCDTDALFLLRFLRNAKFSQLRARELLENFLTAMKKHPEWCKNLDTHSPGVQAFFKAGYFVHTGYDPEGRAVLSFHINRLDVDKKQYTVDDMMQAMVATFYLHIYDEENQVHGNTYFFDCSDFTMKQHTFFGMENSKKSTKLWQNGFPARYKAFHYYNIGPFFEGIMKVMRPVMSKKWVDRIKLHSTMESVYKHIPKANLPLEYLPDDYKGENPGNIDQLAESLHQKMTSPEIRERVMRMTNPEHFDIDLSVKDNVPQESFRKLNID